MNSHAIRILRVILFCLIIYAGGTPLLVNAQHPFVPQTDITYTLPPIPNDTLEALQTRNPNMFAYPFIVDINIVNQGSSILLNDTIYYTIQCASPGAFSLNVLFDSVHIPDNGTIWLYNPQKTSIAGPFSNKNIRNHAFASPLIWDDTICITYSEPFIFQSKSSVIIHQIAHDFKSNNLLKAEALPCNVNIHCNEAVAWQNEKRAVCKLIIGGTSICSGTLLNTTSNDLTPYILTANHCLSTQTSASKTVFYFNYEYDNCEGTGSINTSQYISGSDLIATSPTGKIDFTLLKAHHLPPSEFKVFYAGWDASGNSSKGSVCIHHPRGDAKKISIDTDYFTSATFFSYLKFSHWKISRWDTGTTESGSSGSGLFNMNKQLIGNLSGGEANCDNPVNDYFSKFSSAWDYYDANNEQLKVWLDPENTGKTTCYGYDPNAEYSHIISNILYDDTLVICNFNSKASGTWTGINEIGWKEYADYIPYTTHINIYGISLLGYIDTTQNLNDVVIKVWQGIQKPEQVIYSKPLEKSNCIDSIWIRIIPEQSIVTNGSFWVGYELQNNSTAFTSYMAKPNNRLNSMYVKHPKDWIPTQTIGVNSSLAIQTYLTNQPDTLQSITIDKPGFVSQIQEQQIPLEPIELFVHDSIPCLYDSTRYLLISSDNGIDTWNGPNNLGITCMSNTFKIKEPIYIRGLKIGIANVPQQTTNTTLRLWDKTFSEVLAEKSISNTELQQQKYNQIHFANPILITETFAAGICFSEDSYTNNISIYNLHNTFTNTSASMYIPNKWYDLEQYGYDAIYAIQPITAYSAYHYNPDSLRVLTYPIQLFDSVTIANPIPCIVFPNPCTDYVSIQFTETLASSIHINLYNSSGHRIVTQDISQKNGLFTLSTETLPKGVYIIDIKINNRKSRKAFVKL